jgi:hypothetical protein
MRQEQETLARSDLEVLGGVTPIIELHPKVLEDKVPYVVSVDPERCAQFLADVGMSKTQIQRTWISIRRVALINPFKVFGMDVAGAYNPLTDKITVYTDWAWKRYQRRLAIAERIAHGRERTWPFNKRDERFLNRGVRTQKLPAYLRTVDPERSIPFAERMLLKASNRRHDSVLIHETKHNLDWITPSKKPIVFASMGLKMGTLYGTAILFSLTVGEHITPTNIGVLDSVVQQLATLAAITPTLLAEYKIDPLEIRARNFDKANSHKPEYHSMVSLTPKS